MFVEICFSGINLAGNLFQVIDIPFRVKGLYMS